MNKSSFQIIIVSLLNSFISYHVSIIILFKIILISIKNSQFNYPIHNLFLLFHLNIYQTPSKMNESYRKYIFINPFFILIINSIYSLLNLILN